MNYAKVRKYLPQLIGKTIKKVVYSEPTAKSFVPAQVFFEFENGERYEIYGGDSLHFTGLIMDQDDYSIDSQFKNAEINNRNSAKADKKGIKFSKLIS